VNRVTDPSDQPTRRSDSFWHQRRPGLRYIFSVAALIGGIVSIARFAVMPDESWRLVSGIVVIALGLLSIPVYAWMDRRRL
jgi:hypothetical protein